ncbi:hypothetical protein [Kitasatospora aburaviensis]|uniref:Uncharacterized protein n=1 Tax=Kitasatospora aburaviensis TaxID=67265 RepID=A0ABW1F7H5_9ACTN
MIAREELVEALAASAAETTAGTGAQAETVSSPAPVPGSIVPPWREGLPVPVPAPDYRRLGVLDERQGRGPGAAEGQGDHGHRCGGPHRLRVDDSLGGVSATLEFEQVSGEASVRHPLIVRRISV